MNTNALDRKRLASEPLNVSGKYIANESVKNDQLLLRIEENMNKLAFGVQKLDQSMGAPKEEKLQRSVKSAKRAYSDKKQWRIGGKQPGMTVENYLEEYDKELGDK